MGTGSGILAAEAYKTAEKVYAVDIDPEAVAACKRDHEGVIALESDLFSCFDTPEYRDLKFDLIMFNPPYLPDHPKARDIALDGGKHGYEVAERFLGSAGRYLKTDGKILLLFSSLTKKQKIDEFIRDSCMEFTLLDSLKLDFEELFVYIIEKSSLLKALEKRGISDVRYLAKGKRGIIYTGSLEKRKVTIKASNPGSHAIGRIENETRMLRKVNKKNIGPKFLFSAGNFLAYVYVDGKMILDFIAGAEKKRILDILDDLFRQLYTLDTMGISKEEMHHPVKHILVGKRPVLIDFERAHHTQRPQNVTQFLQFLVEISPLLRKSGILLEKDSLIKSAKSYTRDHDIEKVMEVLK
jgi:HemK-related putative methylase